MFEVSELLEATQGKLITGKDSIEIKGISIDSRTIKPKEVFIAIKGNNFDGHDFINEAIKKGASVVISQNPKQYPISNIQYPDQNKASFIIVKDTIRALGDIARFWRQKFDLPVIAVTGSNGKTTVKEMLAWVLSKRFKVLKNEGTKNNQFGLPLTLLDLDASYDIAVLEIGTNHFGEIENLAKICQPNIGIITNIGPSHLEYLHNLTGIFKEKYTLIKNLKKPRLAVLNSDDSLLKKGVIKNTKDLITIGFGLKNKSDFFASQIKNNHQQLRFLVNKKYKITLDTLGGDNVYNALATIAVARIFGLNYKDIASRLATFDFPEGRLKIIKLNRIRFIDDTYNSNPLSLKQALEALNSLRIKGRKIFVMGDMLELGKYSKLFHAQAGSQAIKVCNVFITVGKFSQIAAKEALRSNLDAKVIFSCASLSEARQILFNRILPTEDDIILVKGSRLMKMEEIIKM